MPDLSWQSILSAAATAIVSAWCGSWWGRSRERVKWEEQSAAELRKARVEAILAIAHALGRHHRATVKALIYSGTVGDEATIGADALQRAPERLSDALQRRSETARELLDVAFEKMFLVPPDLRAVLNNELSLVVGAETPEASRDAVSRMAVAVEEYLPPMRKLQRALPFSAPVSTSTQLVAGDQVSGSKKDY